MPGNLRKRISNGKTGRTERDYLRARDRVFKTSQICAGCGNAIDLTLKPICQFVKTDGYTVEQAHLIPLTCGEGCREAKHARKSNPWGKSADHKIPVSELPPDSPLLTSTKNLDPFHLVCNQRKGDRKAPKARNKTSRDWFV